MRYWDASAIAPLVISEASTEATRGWLREDPTIVTWCWTSIELVSAVERRFREGELTRGERRACLDAFASLTAAWDEVIDLEATRKRARSVLARYPLRAADAAQLGAALLVAEDDPDSVTFVCLDERLSLAAEQEGFRVVP